MTKQKFEPESLSHSALWQLGDKYRWEYQRKDGETMLRGLRHEEIKRVAKLFNVTQREVSYCISYTMNH